MGSVTMIVIDCVTLIVIDIVTWLFFCRILGHVSAFVLSHINCDLKKIFLFPEDARVNCLAS